MASAKDLRKKIRSISNTKKITRTMELVSTAKAKRAQDRLNASTPYSRALAEILENLARAGTVSHPLLESPPRAAKTLLFVITANRGLCGGYNSNVLALGARTLREEEAAGRKVEIYVAGRKGLAKCRFLKIPVAKSYLNLDDKATFEDARKVAEELLGRFATGEYLKVLVVYTHYHSAGVQRPEVLQLLPITPPQAKEEAKAAAPVDYIFEPDPRTILESLLPLSVKAAFYRVVAESATSEQIARRLAMKMATDNAEEMIHVYTRFYNRTRQAAITKELMEIVSGAEALK